MDIKLEKVSIKDIAEINKIQKIAFKDSYDKYKFCPAYEVSDEQVISFLEKAAAYKILLDGEPVGSIFIYKISDNHYELDTISILPQLQNTGIGGLAVSLVEKLYPNALTWTLSTPETDYRNRHFYEKLGYYQVGSEVINEYLTLIKYRKELNSEKRDWKEN